jgi:beta-glucosidase
MNWLSKIVIYSLYLCSMSASGNDVMTAFSKAEQGGLSAVSSSHVGRNEGKCVVDGQMDTRWESSHSNDQWLAIRFEKPMTISTIDIAWERARAKAFAVEVSMDGENWQRVFETNNGGGDSIALNDPVNANYIKIVCSKRATQWGFSIYEININGKSLARDIKLDLADGRKRFKDAAFMNITLSADARVNDLVSRMTLDEKIDYLGGTGFVPNKKIGETQPLTRFGLPAFKMTDATLGSKLTEGATLFPAFIGLAASFDSELAADYGRAVAEQCKADGFRILLGPGVNLYRVPNCGRNFEYLGEDPCLTTRLVVPYIKAVQDAGVLATVKHFVANNSEYSRKTSNSVVGERALQEIYYPPFKAAVQEADVKAVMTGYNLVNGEWAGQHKHLITDVLRGDWGFNGMVMTDWWAVNDGKKTILSGNDIEMPNANNTGYSNIKKFLNDGTISESYLDQRVANILRPICEMGLFDIEQEDPTMRPKWAEHRVTASKVSRDGLVLLKNSDSILPFDSTVKTVALVGRNAIQTSATGGGAAGFDPGPDFRSYKQAIETVAGRYGVKISHSATADDKVKNADVAVVFVTLVEHESGDRPFKLDPEQLKMIDQTATLNPDTIVIVSVGGGIEMASWIGKVRGVIYSWYPGTYGTAALAQTLFGESNPSGKLPISIEKQVTDTHYAGNYLPEGAKLTYKWPGWGQNKEIHDVNYREGVFTGYRWYDTQNIEPLFPFGHGLSYTTFKVGEPKLSSSIIKQDGKTTVKVDVTNTGKTAGAEVVQLYIAAPKSDVKRPVRELKNFGKVFLQPGETKAVTMQVEWQDLAFWDMKISDWNVVPGSYKIEIGTSSRDIKQTIDITCGSSVNEARHDR